MKTKLLNRAIQLTILLFNTAVFSQWSSNSAVNNPICTVPFLQNQQVAISDGSGGAIIAWADKRSGTGVGAEQEFTDIYAQRINAAGVLQWLANGVPICTVAGRQHLPAIISDNNGGAIISWSDERNSATNNNDIYAQKINSSGIVQWSSNGVSICTKINAQSNSAIASDGNGGAIITWEDRRNAIDDNIFAQSINSMGITQWNLDGILVCNATNNQKNPQIIATETGQSIIVWEDSRIANAVYDIYALKINNGGGNAWGGAATNGVAICTASDNQLEPKLVSDGNFGAIITWYDRRNGLDYNIYAQKINANGIIPWLSVGGQGIAICLATGNQSQPQICADATNGAIITWDDTRQSPTESDIYIQRITTNGGVLWGVDGSGVITTAGNQLFPAIISNGDSGAIVSWTDYRNGANADVYCQQFDSSGFAQWSGNIIIGGVVVCNEASSQATPTTIIQDAVGGAIVVWKDDRNANSDIYAQKINSTGTLEIKNQERENQSIIMYPNPTQNGSFSIQSKTTIQEVTAFDILGKEISVEKNNDSYKLNASSGIYTIKISDIDGNSQIKKIIIN